MKNKGHTLPGQPRSDKGKKHKVQDTSVRKVGSGLARCPLCNKGCSRHHNKGQEDKKTGCNGFGMSVEEVRDAKRMRLSLPEEEEEE